MANKAPLPAIAIPYKTLVGLLGKSPKGKLVELYLGLNKDY
jgi:hypothetical protein